MIFGDLEVYNAAESYEIPGGTAFRRVPLSVEEHLTPHGQELNREAGGIELRFVLLSEKASITVKAVKPGAMFHAIVYFGDFIADDPDEKKPVTENDSVITVERPGWIEQMHEIADTHHHRFSPDVVRILLTEPAAIVKTEGEIRPPKKEEVPEKTYLAYGSSITFGYTTVERYSEFVFRIGEDLGLDTRNLGYAGSCKLEPEMADYLASQPFDIATLELGVNVLGMDTEEFRGLVRYFVKTVASSHPGKPVIVTDIFCCYADICHVDTAEILRKVVSEVVSELSLPNVAYVDGLSVFPDGKYLSAGLTHPGPRGAELIAENLGNVMKKYL